MNFCNLSRVTLYVHPDVENFGKIQNRVLNI